MPVLSNYRSCQNATLFPVVWLGVACTILLRCDGFFCLCRDVHPSTDPSNDELLPQTASEAPPEEKDPQEKPTAQVYTCTHRTHTRAHAQSVHAKTCGAKIPTLSQIDDVSAPPLLMTPFKSDRLHLSLHREVLSLVLYEQILLMNNRYVG